MGLILELTQIQDEELTLQYAAYEPESLKNGKKNPLIIWLHGQGEGGTDTDITLLGNEVVALAKDDIQSHFKAGKQTGAQFKLQHIGWMRVMVQIYKTLVDSGVTNK